MATKKEATTITLPELKLQQFTLKIVGDTPLISHAWSTKAKQMILNKQTKTPKEAHEIRRPYVEFADTLYWLTEKPNFDGLTNEQALEVLQAVIPKSKFGFPILAFKSAALDAGFQQGALVRNAGTGDLAKTTARGAFRVIGTIVDIKGESANEFAVINGVPTIREDMVKIGVGTSAIAYRAEFKSWSTDILILYNTAVITPEQIINLFRLGGFSNGVGDWRPAKDGAFGTFHVE